MGYIAVVLFVPSIIFAFTEGGWWRWLFALVLTLQAVDTVGWNPFRERARS